MCKCTSRSLTRTGKTSLGYLQSPRNLVTVLQALALYPLLCQRFSGTLLRPTHLKYGSVNPGFIWGYVCQWQLTNFCLVLDFCLFFIFETGSYCGRPRWPRTHRDPPPTLPHTHTLATIGPHYISVAGIELNMDVTHQAGLNL